MDQRKKANYQLVLSEKNREILQDAHGYLYWKNMSRGERIYWRCIFFQAGADGDIGSKCPGRAVTANTNVLITNKHNHLGDIGRVELKRMQASIQRKAIDSKQAPRSIIANSLSRVLEVAKPLVRRSLLARNIRNIRHEANIEPANPKNLNGLMIPEEYKLLEGENFLKYDGWNKSERVLIYSTNRCLDLLQSVDKWGCDGTFDVVPVLFDQLWIVFIRLSHSYVPMVFCLMNRRLQSSYEFVLSRLLELRPNICPKSIAVDFEMAEFGAFKKIFPEIEIRACFSHLQKSVVRNVYEKGQKFLYDTNSSF